MEVETQVIIARELMYLAERDLNSLQAQLEEVGRMLNGLIQSLRNPSRAAA
jgi:four helix bundle protein